MGRGFAFGLVVSAACLTQDAGGYAERCGGKAVEHYFPKKPLQLILIGHNFPN
jgi:hypothetical protein